MQVHKAMAEAFAALGDTALFGLIGDGNMLLITSFLKHDSCRYVGAANEGGAVLMASGYAAVTGRVGLATVIKGPGLTNTMTALTEAVFGRLPIIVVAVDTAAKDWHGSQNIPQRDFVLPTGAGFEQTRTPESSLIDLYEAYRRALSESRPVVLNVPRDFWEMEVEYVKPPSRPVTLRRIAPDADDLDTAVGVIASARRPVIIAGRGAANEKSRDALLRLSKRLGAPVSTTLRAKDLFRGLSGDLGIFGTLSSDKTSQVIARTDCVITFGASLNHRTTLSGDLLRGKALVQCDADPTAIGHEARPTAAVVGDAAAVADSFVEWLDRIDASPTTFLDETEALSVPPRAPRPASPPGTVDMLDVLRILETHIPASRVLAVDTGRFMFSVLKSISVSEPRLYVHTAHLGSIGLGLGNAIGAGLGVPDRPTLLVTGDGGLMCSGMAELRTAVTAGLDLVVVVMNDRAYGAEYGKLASKDMDPLPSTIDVPDFAAVAAAIGGQGFTVDGPESLAELPAVLADRKGMLLVDVLLDRLNIPRAAAMA